MEVAIYTWMALLGGGLLVLQLVLQVLGLDADTDVDAAGDVGDLDADGAVGADGNIFFGILSFKALVAFCALFGLTGLTLHGTDVPQGLRLLYSALAGFGGMVLVAWLMRMLHGLASSGTVQLEGAVGKQANVYLRIPAKGEGRGKVSLDLQGRSVELGAVTDGDEIPTGQRVRIVEVLPDEIVRVEAGG